MCRDKSKFNSESYENDLDVALNEYFTHLSPLNNQNYNKIFNNFTLTVSLIINKHAPLASLSRRQRKLKFKPWITKGILVSIENENSMFKSHFTNGTKKQLSYFKSYSNKLTKIKANAKKIYFFNELNKHYGNSKKNKGHTLLLASSL